MDIINDFKHNDLNNIRIEKQQEKKREFKLFGKLRKIPGLTLYSYNQESCTLKKAELERNVYIGIDGLPIYKTSTIVEDKCIYFQALNKKSAKRKLEKKGLKVKE